MEIQLQLTRDAHDALVSEVMRRMGQGGTIAASAAAGSEPPMTDARVRELLTEAGLPAHQIDTAIQQRNAIEQGRQDAKEIERRELLRRGLSQE